MYKVDGIIFSGCSFRDNRSNPVLAFNNTGIRSVDAKYTVRGRCPGTISACPLGHEDPNWDPTLFTNLFYGIDAISVSTDYSIRVETSVFTNNKYGIEMTYINSPEITQNKFNYNTTANLYSDKMYGIHAIHSQDLRIEENDFISTAPSVLGFTAGVVCSDLGGTEEEIYKNYFENLTVANFSQGQNRNWAFPTWMSGWEGLQFNCNTNVTNRLDHFVLGTLFGSEPPAEDYGVRNNNGSTVKVSGNEFTQSGPHLDYDNESLNNVHYYYFDDMAGQVEVPMEVDGFFTDEEVPDLNSCPSNIITYPTGGLPATTALAVIALFNNFDGDYADKLNEYLNLVDGGSTADLLQVVENLAPPNKQQVRQQLLDISPYVSEDVIRVAVNPSPLGAFPHPFALELILNNVDVARDPAFIEFLRTKTHPMPEDHISQILSELEENNFTDRYIREPELSDLSAERNFYVNLLLRDVQQDSVVNTDSLRHWLRQKNDALVQYRIIDSYLQDQNFRDAKIEIEKLELSISTFPLEIQLDIIDFVSLKRILLNLLTVPGDIADPSNPNHLLITDIAENGQGLAQYQARSILCFFFEQCEEYIIEEPVLTRSPGFESAQKNEPIGSSATFKVYPNPGTDYVAFELPESDKNWMIIVRDISGKVIHTELTDQTVYIWNSSNYNGAYFVEVKNDLEHLGLVKLILTN